jgi:hypothetical protein
MNKVFLDKVVDHILYETKFNFKDNIITTPFQATSNLPMNYLVIPYIHLADFYQHCRRIYSVGNQEINYVVKEYKKNLYLKLRSECPKKYLFL